MPRSRGIAARAWLLIFVFLAPCYRLLVLLVPLTRQLALLPSALAFLALRVNIVFVDQLHHFALPVHGPVLWRQSHHPHVEHVRPVLAQALVLLQLLLEY